MLGLLTPTCPSWAIRAQEDLAGLLSDHAHCELKAASSALAMVARFGEEYPVLVAPFSALAAEETAHFRAVHGQILARSVKFTRPAADDYVNALWSQTKLERARTPILLDRLVVGALIEARSCERFKLLSDALDDSELSAFYRGLMESEARHYRLFCELAEELFGVSTARLRLRVLADREACVASELPLGPKVHG
jgi:tRNA-(ms[2]io[6]A)-hydroxylase